MRRYSLPFIILFLAAGLQANPYFDPGAVPIDLQTAHLSLQFPAAEDLEPVVEKGIKILRVDLNWDEENDRFLMARFGTELSGTPALLRRTRKRDPHGSYHGQLVERGNNRFIAENVLGTGKEFRKLTRALTFRLPIPDKIVDFRLVGEHPVHGRMIEMLRHRIDPARLKPLRKNITVEPDVRILKPASSSQKLLFNIYAEGYLPTQEQAFWRDALRVVRALENDKLPGLEHLEFRGVFAPSNQRLGRAEDRGELQIQDTFLGLYFPYWHGVGRWYNIVYPTSGKKYRDAAGLVPYDYILGLIKDHRYWGVGNFKELTAVPIDNRSFTYLLMHELGHFFGLNEEYNQGGPTELAFAPEIAEPWSQNLTFVNERSQLKWRSFVNAQTPIPTPRQMFRNNASGPWGAYRGGYASTDPQGREKIPGLQCRMSNGDGFCAVCGAAIAERIQFDLGN